MKKIIIVILIFILGIYYINYSNINCIEKEISILNLSSIDKNICNYDIKLINLFNYDEKFNILNFYNISKIDIGVGIIIINKFINENGNEISLLKKIQIYYILKDIYKYDERSIEYIIGYINSDYKNIGLSVKKIISAENLLTQVFEGDEDTIDGIKSVSGKLSYLDLKFLQIVFDLEVTRFNSINLVTNLRGGYNVLLDNKSRKLYILIMNDLLINVGNNNSEIIINRFLNSLK